ncbi:unnamed protein product [Symbiodinium natans]|uniref:Reverse transcriptase domain-containing protein n=1 Tax=Symbiodinium natans TaxID=878477 RepID=A0A812ST49_9DINO|nr:unnamed protein product [Symbiodinium natans]
MEVPSADGSAPAGAMGAPVGGMPMSMGNPAFTHQDRGSPRTPAPRLPGFTAAGRLRQPSPTGELSGVELLLLQQNQLLMSQLKELQAQVQTSQSREDKVAASEALKSKLFQQPQDLLDGVDPALRKIFDDFTKEVRQLLSAWETQTKLLEKYKKLVEEGQLHSHFKAEAEFRWQFTKIYLAQAMPTAGDDMSDAPFSVVDAWAAMRERHAKECFEFIVQHQEKCVNLYDGLIECTALKQSLLDKLDAWFAQHSFADADICGALKLRAEQYVESLLRAERPKVQSRMVKDRELQQKREQALLEARSKWEEMDVKDVLSPALFELKQLDAKHKRPTKIKDDSALAFLVKDNAELCQKHKLKIVDPKEQPFPFSDSKIAKGRSFWLDEDRCSIDFYRFCVAQSLRTGFYALLHRQVYKGVHNLVPADVITVPKYVLLHVAKGGKFIPTSKPTSVPRVIDGLGQLRRQLLLRKHFAAHPDAAVMSKCRLRSAWQPPSDPHIDAYVRLALRELAEFEPKPFKSNQSWLDRKAQSWLRSHAEFVCIVDCDKGLGDALVLRSWVVEQVHLQLAQGYTQVTPAVARRQMAELKQFADAMLHHFAASGLLSRAEILFFLSSFGQTAAGTFRILVKVHKCPTGSRPICNLRHCWFQPFSVFLVEKLGPLVSSLSSVIVSTDQLLQQLDHVTCLPTMCLVTLDVVNLYPSVCRRHMMSLVAPFVRQRMSNQSLCEFIIRALELVLEACVVSFDGCWYQSRDGIPTGLSVASILANIYLWHFDNFLLQQGGEQLQLIRRFIDDLLLLWSGDVSLLTSLANSWHESLRFDLSAHGDVHFLDVALTILPNRRIHWSLFHKPQNLYLYVPAHSNHPASALKSLQIGGALRCQKRNRLCADALASLKLFKRRLKDRGFDLKRFDVIIAKYQRCPKKHAPSVRKVHLKIPYNKDVSPAWISSKLRKHSALLKRGLPDVQPESLSAQIPGNLEIFQS